MSQSSTVRFGDFEADLRSGELRKQGYRIRVQEKPFQVLAAILERPGELVTREELQQRLWGKETFVDFDNNLNTAVYKLREALNDPAEQPRLIETLPKKGYRFIGTILPAGAAAAPYPAKQGAAAKWRLVVAGSLVTALVGAASYFALGTGTSSASAGSASPAAREWFLKGQYLAQKGGAENQARAAEFFEQAIAVDAKFARAYAALADALSGRSENRRENAARAKAAAMRAIELDPSLAEAHHRLGSLHLYEEWNWEEAARAFARAAKLAPDSAEVHHSYAGYFSLMGQHERALEEMQHALRLNPVSVAVSADTGWYWFVARRYDEAIVQAKKALEVEPQHRGAHYYVLLALLAKGDIAEARNWALKYLAILGAKPEELARVRAGDAAAGLRAFWGIRLAAADARSKSERVPAQEMALLYAALGETDHALTYLERAYEERSGWLLPFMRVYPPLDTLRTQPRFAVLQQKMNFPTR